MFIEFLLAFYLGPALAPEAEAVLQPSALPSRIITWLGPPPDQRRPRAVPELLTGTQ